MTRVADATIKGFLYQFNLTLKSVLESNDDDEILAEGVIEDIDVSSELKTEAIQCKYHEAQEKYTLSNIYKPILQMLKTNCQVGDPNLTFRLHMYFPNEDQRVANLSFDELTDILKNKDKKLISAYLPTIFPISDDTIRTIAMKEKKSESDKDTIKSYYTDKVIESEIKKNEQMLIDFINKLTLVYGESFDKIIENNKNGLQCLGFETDDVNEIFYPNAINDIAKLSVNPLKEERIVKKQEFIQHLKQIKTTAISRWTKELLTYNKLLEIRRKQLAPNLNINLRKRYYIIDISQFDNFYNDIVVFICDYINKYTFKPKLHHISLFCFVNGTEEQLKDVEARLYQQSVKVETGYAGDRFFIHKFLTEPRKFYSEGKFEFYARICNEDDEIIDIINNNQPHDLFFITKEINPKYLQRDLNIEHLYVNKFNELRYLLKMTDEV